MSFHNLNTSTEVLSEEKVGLRLEGSELLRSVDKDLGKIFGFETSVGFQDHYNAMRVEVKSRTDSEKIEKFLLKNYSSIVQDRTAILEHTYSGGRSVSPISATAIKKKIEELQSGGSISQSKISQLLADWQKKNGYKYTSVKKKIWDISYDGKVYRLWSGNNGRMFVSVFGDQTRYEGYKIKELEEQKLLERPQTIKEISQQAGRFKKEGFYLYSTGKRLAETGVPDDVNGDGIPDDYFGEKRTYIAGTYGLEKGMFALKKSLDPQNNMQLYLSGLSEYSAHYQGGESHAQGFKIDILTQHGNGPQFRHELLQYAKKRNHVETFHGSYKGIVFREGNFIIEVLDEGDHLDLAIYSLSYYSEFRNGQLSLSGKWYPHVFISDDGRLYSSNEKGGETTQNYGPPDTLGLLGDIYDGTTPLGARIVKLQSQLAIKMKKYSGGNQAATIGIISQNSINRLVRSGNIQRAIQYLSLLLQKPYLWNSVDSKQISEFEDIFANILKLQESLDIFQSIPSFQPKRYIYSQYPNLLREITDYKVLLRQNDLPDNDLCALLVNTQISIFANGFSGIPRFLYGKSMDNNAWTTLKNSDFIKPISSRPDFIEFNGNEFISNARMRTPEYRRWMESLFSNLDSNKVYVGGFHYLLTRAHSFMKDGQGKYSPEDKFLPHSHAGLIYPKETHTIKLGKDESLGKYISKKYGDNFDYQSNLSRYYSVLVDNQRISLNDVLWGNIDTRGKEIQITGPMIYHRFGKKETSTNLEPLIFVLSRHEGGNDPRPIFTFVGFGEIDKRITRSTIPGKNRYTAGISAKVSIRYSEKELKSMRKQLVEKEKQLQASRESILALGDIASFESHRLVVLEKSLGKEIEILRDMIQKEENNLKNLQKLIASNKGKIQLIDEDAKTTGIDFGENLSPAEKYKRRQALYFLYGAQSENATTNTFLLFPDKDQIQNLSFVNLDKVLEKEYITVDLKGNSTVLDAVTHIFTSLYGAKISPNEIKYLFLHSEAARNAIKSYILQSDPESLLAELLQTGEEVAGKTWSQSMLIPSKSYVSIAGKKELSQVLDTQLEIVRQDVYEEVQRLVGKDLEGILTLMPISYEQLRSITSEPSEIASLIIIWNNESGKGWGWGIVKDSLPVKWYAGSENLSLGEMQMRAKNLLKYIEYIIQNISALRAGGKKGLPSNRSITKLQKLLETYSDYPSTDNKELLLKATAKLLENNSMFSFISASALVHFDLGPQARTGMRGILGGNLSEQTSYSTRIITHLYNMTPKTVWLHEVSNQIGMISKEIGILDKDKNAEFYDGDNMQGYFIYYVTQILQHTQSILSESYRPDNNQYPYSKRLRDKLTALGVKHMDIEGALANIAQGLDKDLKRVFFRRDKKGIYTSQTTFQVLRAYMTVLNIDISKITAGDYVKDVQYDQPILLGTYHSTGSVLDEGQRQDVKKKTKKNK